MGLLLFCSMLFALVSASRNLPIIPFDEGYAPLFGDSNLVIHRDGKSVHISLDERTGFFFLLFRMPPLSIYVGLLRWWFLWLKSSPFWFFHFWGVFAGSGFVSHDLYLHGYFSASIKLPADYTAGVVVAFYVSILPQFYDSWKW